MLVVCVCVCVCSLRWNDIFSFSLPSSLTPTPSLPPSTKAIPYHLNMTCRQFVDSRDSSKHCRFCDVSLPPTHPPFEPPAPPPPPPPPPAAGPARPMGVPIVNPDIARRGLQVEGHNLGYYEEVRRRIREAPPVVEEDPRLAYYNQVRRGIREPKPNKEITFWRRAKVSLFQTVSFSLSHTHTHTHTHTPISSLT